MINKYSMSYDLNKIFFVKLFTMKCHTCRDEMRILDVDWLHPYLSYDLPHKPNKIPTRQTEDNTYGQKKTRCGNNGFKLKN